MLHVLGDLIQSIGVLIAAILIYVYGKNAEGVYEYNSWHLADPITTYIFSILVLFTTTSIIKDSIYILMEGTPTGIEIKEIEA